MEKEPRTSAASKGARANSRHRLPVAWSLLQVTVSSPEFLVSGDFWSNIALLPLDPETAPRGFSVLDHAGLPFTESSVLVLEKEVGMASEVLMW